MASTEQPTVSHDLATEVTGSLAQTAAALYSAGSVEDTLQLVVDLAVETIDGCDFAGIFVLDRGSITTVVHTHPVVVDVDGFQHATGEGPCLDAVASGGTFYVEELNEDPRWPDFGPRAHAAGVRSALSLSLSAEGTGGALNLYARYPQAFGVVDRGKGLILASLAGLALSSAVAHDDEERRNANLQAGLITREVIGQAEGILMERERITSDEAFDILRRASQHLNVKLRDVAQTLVDTGERPETDTPTP